MIRGVEIRLRSGRRPAVGILPQVTYGIAVRMAVMALHGGDGRTHENPISRTAA